MEYGRVYRRTKEEQALCMAKCTGGPRGPHSRRKSEIGLCCAEECGPVTMHMIDVAERDRGTVCRRVAAYYIAKATALGYAGDHDGARRAFRKFLVFAKAERAETAGRADRSEKTDRTERAARTGKAEKTARTGKVARTDRTQRAQKGPKDREGGEDRKGRD
jgi:hypothetical protein